MSKLLDRLERAASGPARPVGFGRAVRERIPALVIIASVTDAKKATVEAAVSAGAEFVILNGKAVGNGKGVPPVGIGSTPWGVRLESLSEEVLAKLKESGCDFVVLTVGGTPIRLLNDESMDYFSIVPVGSEEQWLRAVDDLPFEGNLVEMAADGDLTLTQALGLAAVAGRLSGELIVGASPEWGAGELESLREMGFGAVMVEVKTAADAEKLAALREAALNLPSQSARRRGRPQARVPQAANSVASAPDDDDDGDDDDDD